MTPIDELKELLKQAATGKVIPNVELRAALVGDAGKIIERLEDADRMAEECLDEHGMWCGQCGGELCANCEYKKKWMGEK